jgi:hypothetical protein
MSNEPMVIWTIFRRPADYPNHHVARKFLVFQGYSEATDEVIVSEDLQPLRYQMERQGLYRMNRDPNDDPAIVETWL